MKRKQKRGELKNKLWIITVFLFLLVLLSLVNGCVPSKEEQAFQSEVDSILMEVFGNYKFQSLRTTLGVTELNYSANYISDSYNKFLEIKPSLENALKNKGYTIKSSISANEITVTIGGKTTTTPAQIQINTEKDNVEINFKIERTTNNRVSITVTKGK